MARSSSRSSGSKGKEGEEQKFAPDVLDEVQGAGKAALHLRGMSSRWRREASWQAEGAAVAAAQEEPRREQQEQQWHTQPWQQQQQHSSSSTAAAAAAVRGVRQHPPAQSGPGPWAGRRAAPGCCGCRTPWPAWEAAPSTQQPLALQCSCVRCGLRAAGCRLRAAASRRACWIACAAALLPAIPVAASPIPLAVPTTPQQHLPPATAAGSTHLGQRLLQLLHRHVGAGQVHHGLHLDLRQAGQAGSTATQRLSRPARQAAAVGGGSGGARRAAGRPCGRRGRAACPAALAACRRRPAPGSAPPAASPARRRA